MQQIDALRDAAVAVMSTSALLLTLLLAFFPSLSVASSNVTVWVLWSSRLLLMSVFSNAVVLAIIISNSGQGSTYSLREVGLLLLLSFAPFLFATVVMSNVVNALSP